MRRPPSARRPRTAARRSGPITSAVGATGDGDAGGGPATTTTTVTDISGPTATMVTTGDIAGSSTVGAGGIDQRGFRRIGAAKIPARRRLYPVIAACTQALAFECTRAGA